MWPAKGIVARRALLLGLAAGILPAAAAPPEPAAWRVGLIAGTDPWSASLAAGAAAAAERINRAGGINDHPLVLTSLPVARPWQDGAARIARLAAAPGTVALLGAADGAEAHLAAQVATRLRLPLITVSPEVTLTQAGSTWVFRAVADDREQARSLLARLPGGAAGRRGVLVVPAGREGRERLAALRRACAESGMNQVDLLTVPEAAAGLQPPPPARGDIVLLWLDAGPARRLLERWGERLPSVPVLGSSRLNHPAFLRGLHPGGTMLPGGRAESPQRLGRDLVNRLATALAQTDGDTDALRATLAVTPFFSGKKGRPTLTRHGNRREADPARVSSAER
ncbi:MAG: ABC transporter substrate-binding protein [Rhodospirillales bacterium]